MQIANRLAPRTNRYIPVQPTTRQRIFLILNDVLEVLYGGAAAGGKSEALLYAATQYVDVPQYSALILRRSFRDLALPGALMDRSHSWFSNTDAHWDGTEYQWTFPSGATIQFGYLERPNDHLRYQSAQFQCIVFDELTQFSEEQYTYMFSRLRRLGGSGVPIRMRSATNPGGPGHAWVKKRFNLPYGVKDDWDEETKRDRKFVFAKLEDNPHVDQDTYDKALSQLTDVTRAQLRTGDWDAESSGGMFEAEDFWIIDQGDLPPSYARMRQVRHWDFGSSSVTGDNPDPDWTAGAKVSQWKQMPRGVFDVYRDNGWEVPKPPYWIVEHVARDRRDPGGVEELVRTTALLDGVWVVQSIEQERGAAGKQLVAAYRSHILPGYRVMPLFASGDKQTRAKAPAARAREGRVFVVAGHWTEAFIDECVVFNPEVNKNAKDDQVDGMSGAFIQLEKMAVMEEGSGQVEQH